jgi:hypothetical protein
VEDDGRAVDVGALEDARTLWSPRDALLGFTSLLYKYLVSVLASFNLRLKIVRQVDCQPCCL